LNLSTSTGCTDAHRITPLTATGTAGSSVVENRFELTVPPHDSAGACLSEVSRPDNDIPHLPQTEGPRSDPLMQRRPHLLYGTATPAIDHVGLLRAPFPVGNIRAASLSSPSRTCTGHTASHAAPNHGSIASIRGTTPSSSYRGWKVASHPVRHLPHPNVGGLHPVGTVDTERDRSWTPRDRACTL